MRRLAPLRRAAALLGAALSLAAAPAQPWRNPALPPLTRARLAAAALTQDEKLSLVTGWFGNPWPSKHYTPPPEARPGSAGYVPGIPRLGIPPQWETDAGIGVATQVTAATHRERTALPSGLATAATWDPALAFQGGAMIGHEARQSGFDVQLAGGVNLARDPRNGRNFEYAGEDPLLAGTMVGAEIAGIQSNHIISTTKHFALNDQETARFTVNATINEAAARESDLLAFEIAIERGHPGSVMCSYNRLNGPYTCDDSWLLDTVLKTDWHYPFYVMSDWGAVHATTAAAHGLDQESAALAFDDQVYFGPALKAAIAAGTVAPSRLDDMARRILNALFATGVVDDPPVPGPIDLTADGAVTERDEQSAIVLLKNTGALPLGRNLRHLAVIGGHADVGVLSGGGSAQVFPAGGSPVPNEGPASFPGPTVYDPSSPLQALAARLPQGAAAFAAGNDVAQAVALAQKSDAAIVFATSWSAENQDTPLALPNDQDALIAAVAHANKNTVVVLETGGPVLMPWLPDVAAVVEAWFPGTSGAPAIASVLFGEVDAAGRLPLSFPAAAAQLPRPRIDGADGAPNPTAQYFEGAAVGYKWYARTRQTPLFPFGFGLSYGTTRYSGFTATAAGTAITASFDVRNTSTRPVADVPQIYLLSDSFDDAVKLRLAGWQKLALRPHETRHVRLILDPRLSANWSLPAHAWKIPGGPLTVALGPNAATLVAKVRVTLPQTVLKAP